MTTIVVFVTILATSLFMWAQFGNVTRKISSEYAQFYTDKLVGDLGSYINREIGIAVSASRNSAIVDWMKNEEDGQRRAAAFQELQTVLQVLHDKNGFIALEGSKQSYYMKDRSDGMYIEAQGVLNKANTADAWYFNTLQETPPYNMNIEYNRLLHVTRVWINVKVREDGRNLGVFGTGLTIDSILHNIFSKYQHDGAKSVIVNGQGQIVVDSDSSEAEWDRKELNETLFQYSDDPLFTEQAKDYLADAGSPTVIRMDHNHYQYAAFAPILDSNWHVVTFFRKNALYAPVNFKFIVGMFLLIVLVLSIAISLIVQKIFTAPFQKLKASLQGKEAYQNHSIYGLERKDEFGVLANSIQKMTDRIVQSVPVGIFLLDPKGRLLYGNPCFLSQFDCETKEQFQQWAQQERASLFARQEDLDRVQAVVRESLEECFIEAELLSRRQQSFWAEIHLTKVPNQQAGYHYEGILINVQVKKYYEQNLIDMAATDRLTGVFNRHHFEQTAMGELDRHERSGVRCTLIFFDLDHFKCVNDNWGHDAGDEVLVNTADIVRESTRKSDIILRWGGEEFAVLLVDCGLAEGGRVAEEIRLKLANWQHPIAGVVTASFGVVQRSGAEAYADWFKRGDLALYKAKQSGRNRVVIDEA
ncbi:diguanylate cyclase [Paenibacillus rhizovicinus]|uniref:Diguanylate cyclase n=1 Tax=Paenibacillus rhizovicinus TaxID=2704463 RepID=A0A6C0NXT0_9BACL|nr:diguanylate cyclase [Paenibacillus rhizovicinus]QHW31054.1 diguanylate cyclase [Paenibacillus rhizovicinus]